MKTSLLLGCLALAVAGQAQVPKEIGGFQNPESVVAKKNKIYVSNMGAQLDPTAKDGDGFISVLSRKDGRMIEQKFISGLNSPKGMRIKGKKLTIADVDKVVVYNVKNKKKIKEVSLRQEGENYANDVTRKAGGALVSGTMTNGIYKVDTKNAKTDELDVNKHLPGVNGLDRKLRRIYVANYGRGENPQGNFGKLRRNGKKYVTYQTGGVYDGIVKLNRRLIVSDWGQGEGTEGKLIAYKLGKKKAKVIDIGRTINGPADIAKDRKNKVVWVPEMRENKILSIAYETVKE